MKVSELIKVLESYPQDLPVVVSGYEGGLNDVNQFENVKMVRDYHTAWYYGEHEYVDGVYGDDVDVEKLKSNAVDALRIG